MRDNELVLRFIAFKTRLIKYQGNFKTFLDDTTKYFNKAWDAEQVFLDSLICNMNAGIDCVFDTFAKDSFQVYEDNEYTGRFNRAVFDIMLYFLSDDYVRDATNQQPVKVRKAFEDLCTKDREFRQVLSVNTKDTGNVFIRFSRWADSLREELGIRQISQFSITEDRRIIIRS